MYVEYLRVSGGRGRARAGSLSLRVVVAAAPRAGRGQLGPAAPGSADLRRSRVARVFVSRAARAALKRSASPTRRRRDPPATNPKSPRRRRREAIGRRDVFRRRSRATPWTSSSSCRRTSWAPAWGWASCGPRAVARRRARRVQSLLEPSSTRRRRVSTRRRALADFLEGVFAIFECVGVCVFGAEEPRPVLEVLKL